LRRLGRPAIFAGTHAEENALEQTLVILKPNAVQRELIGEIISRFEKRGFRIASLKMLMIDSGLARLHYSQHEGMPFFEDLISFITSGPSVLMVLESQDAVSIARRMIGDTDPAKALPGTIRGDYATTPGHNMIHASDSERSAAREISLFFEPVEICDYSLSVKPWL
jgi:nucleoside-diphosphate kinase